MSKLEESGAKWWHCYKLCLCLLHEDAFFSLTEEYEVALFLVAYTEVKLLGEEGLVPCDNSIAPCSTAE